MKKLLFSVLFSALLAFGCSQKAHPPEPTPEVEVEKAAISVDNVFRLVNEERTKRNVAPLVKNANLMKGADDYARLMARRNILSHGLDGSLGSRVTRTGYKWSACGENIAWNYRSASSVVQGWMSSSGHRRNILNASYKDTGIGIRNNSKGEPYYCQIFGRPQTAAEQDDE